MMNTLIKLLNYRYIKRWKRDLEKQDFKGNIRKLLLSVGNNYCCPIKPLHAAIFSLNPVEIRMISPNFKFQAPLRIMKTLQVEPLPE